MRPAVLLAASLLMGTSATAYALQSETDTGFRVPVPKRARIAEGAAMSDAKRGQLAMNEFARCTLDRDPRAVVRMISSPPGPAYVAALDRVVSPDCLGEGRIKFSPISMRGPLFKQLYMRKSAGKIDAEAGSLSPLQLAVSRAGLDPAEKNYLASMDFGACIAERNLEKSRRVVLAPTASAEQDAAIQALVPDISACLTKGAEQRLSKAAIEAVLAEVVYRGVSSSSTPSGNGVETK